MSILSSIRLLRSLIGRLDYLRHVERLDSIEQMILSLMSPVDRHVFSEASGFPNSFYRMRRANLINKTLEICGTDWSGKRIIELGGGHGDIGAFFADAGAEVLCVEGRTENANIAKLKHRNIPRFTCVQRNLENDFTDLGKFDLVLHFGLLYHIRNIEEHMWNCTQLGNEMLMELEALDSLDDHKVELVEEDKDIFSLGLTGGGVRPSPLYVKRVFNEFEYDVQIITDGKLNYGDHKYDWEHKDDGGVAAYQRRFFHMVRVS